MNTVNACSSDKLCRNKELFSLLAQCVHLAQITHTRAAIYQIAREARASRAYRVTRVFRACDGVHVVVAILCVVAPQNSQSPRSFHSSLRFGNVRNVRISLYGWHILCSAHSRSSCFLWFSARLASRRNNSCRSRRSRFMIV